MDINMLCLFLTSEHVEMQRYISKLSSPFHETPTIVVFFLKKMVWEELKAMLNIERVPQ